MHAQSLVRHELHILTLLPSRPHTRVRLVHHHILVCALEIPNLLRYRYDVLQLLFDCSIR